MHMRKLLFMVSMLFLFSQLLAQNNRTISGKVTDEKGTGVPNASVLIKGTNAGTVTSNDGSFSLSVPSNSRALIISSIGAGEKEISLTNANSYAVTLSTSAKNDLQEVIVVGYGTQKRGTLTSSIGTVKAEDI